MTRREYWRQRRLEQTRTCIDCGAPATVGYYCATHGKETPRPMADPPTSTCRDCGRPLRGTTRSLCLGCLMDGAAP